MKNNSNLLLIIVVAAILVISGLIYINRDTSAVTKKTLLVGPVTVECVGVAPQRCLQVKENPKDDYSLLYQDILGFTFVPGFEYELIVAESEVEDPPADASSIRLELVEIVNKKPVPYVMVNKPNDYATLDSNKPFVILGEGRGLFEGNVVVEVTDSTGDVVGQSVTTMSTEEIGGEGTWKLSMKLDKPATDTVKITAFSPSPADGNRDISYSLTVLVTNDESTDNTNTSLDETKWTLISYSNTEGELSDILKDSEITAAFSDNKLTGSGGCNNYTTSYSINGNAIIFGSIAVTSKACEEKVDMQEIMYFQNLEKTTNFKANESNLELLDDNAQLLIIYKANN